MQHGTIAQFRWHLLDAVQMAAIGLIVIAVAPNLAQLVAMPARLQLVPADYVIVQRAEHAAPVVFAIGMLALAAIGVHTYLIRRRAAAFAWSLVAMAGLAAAQLLQLAIHYPLGVLPSWDIMPDNVEVLRQRWEFVAAIAGVLSVGALLAFVRAVVASRPIASLAILESISRDAAVRAARERAKPRDGEGIDVAKSNVARNIAA